MSAEGSPEERAPLALRAGLALAALYRAAYHFAYLGWVPFARATFSDGRWYEGAARDLLAHPPWGTEVFYLQGLYALQLALGLALTGSLRGALALQVLSCAAALYAVHRAAVRAWGPREGGASTLALLLAAAPMYYENKPLSSALGFALAGVSVASSLRALEDPRPGRSVRAGAWYGLAFLARPNALLAAPFALAAVGLAARRSEGGAKRALGVAAAFALGFSLAVAPMAARNAAVTGRATVLREHAGAAAFYAGNNARARGTWSGGAVLSGDVQRELREAADALGVPADMPREERDRAAAEALTRSAWAHLRANPGAWAALWWRKVWLSVGDDELAQDFDWRGERELLPAFLRAYLPFGALLGLGLLGAYELARRGREARTRAGAPVRGLLLVLLGHALSVCAALVVYFTSSQHRMPLALPLAFCAGPGAFALARAWTERRSNARPLALALSIVLACTLQGLWPRARPAPAPPAAHLFNLALVYDRLAEGPAARAALDRALAQRPAHPVFLLTSATWHARDRDAVRARSELDRYRALPPSQRSGALEEQARALASTLGSAP